MGCKEIDYKNCKRVDLHIHTWCSDSTRSPKEVVEEAQKNGIDLISVCDHNTCEAYIELIPLCKEAALHLLTGVEIQAMLEGVEYHILGYSFDIENEELQELLAYSRSVLVAMGNQLIGKMAVDYEILSREEFAAYVRNLENGGWESIDYLKSKGLAKGMTEYIQFCRQYKIRHENSFKSVQEVVKTIHKAGGKAIVAHAGDMIENQAEIFVPMLEKLLEQEVDGFECYYTSHTSAVTKMLTNFCVEKNLLITAGSDDHGGFNNVINGITYDMHIPKVAGALLELEDILPVSTEVKLPQQR